MKGLSKEVREIMKEYIGDNSVAGVTVLAVQDGKEICDCQEGMADIENGRVMKRDTIFRLYSQTKPVTGAAAMILMERRTGDAGCRSFTDDVGADLWRYDDGAGADV